MKVNIPSGIAVVVGLVLGVLQVINEVVLVASAPTHAYITIVLVFAAGLGISPIVGAEFKARLHISPLIAGLISAALAAAVLALATVQMSGLAHAIVAAALTVLAALGFAPAVPEPIPPVAVAATPAPVERAAPRGTRKR